MINLKIYGRLRKFIGKSSFEIEANSPRKAVNFLIANYENVGEHIKDQEYCILVGGVKIDEDMLDMEIESDVKIIPVVHGNILPFILGGLSLAAGIKGSILGIKLSAAVASFFTSLGSGLLLQGVSNLLAPPPPSVGQQEDPRDQSFVFSGLLNNTKQGVPINIVYGETLIGSTVVSSSVDTFQYVSVNFDEFL
tara:strand:- start:1067 stop:1648 length:582 start_codon:yes stop_codon:yes gene_type:complete